MLTRNTVELLGGLTVIAGIGLVQVDLVPDFVGWIVMTVGFGVVLFQGTLAKAARKPKTRRRRPRRNPPDAGRRAP